MLKRALIPLYNIWTIILNKPCHNSGLCCWWENLLSRFWVQSELTDTTVLYCTCLTANRSVWIACKQSLVIHLQTSGLQTQYLDTILCILSRKNIQMFIGSFHMFYHNGILPDRGPLLFLLLRDSFWQLSLHHLPDKLHVLHCIWLTSQVHFLFHYEYSRIRMISWNWLL